MRKNACSLLIMVLLLFQPTFTRAQDDSLLPVTVSTGTYYGTTPPLKDLPAITDEDFSKMEAEALQKILNPMLEERSYPYAGTALPQGPDAVWQQSGGASREISTILKNFQGQTSPYFPPDANGAVGPEHYMQTVNCTFAIYGKNGNRLVGPTNLNMLFGSVPGAEYNDGDPIVLYDEQADRWLVGEFSISGSNDRMLIAVSTSADPTGTWHQYSFDVMEVPDYEKFGIWQDGYYMGTNTSGGTDIYVFERSQMLGGGTAQMVAFDNQWRPTTIDGFHCVPPVDNDGSPAPAGEPGLFITINDDAIGGGSDQLWIYELDVNWSNPGLSTFSRVQQINVSPFDSNFGNDWDNIAQPGTTRELDAIPMVIMNVPQYRNFGTHETIVCCHTVDVDGTDHAGIRWYELRKVSGSWSIRQQGTYAPDAHSRWMGSVMLNGNDEIGLAYSVSSTSVYPGIRYCAQSASEYAGGTGIMDVAEGIIHTGANSQTAINRWGDYSNLSIDPANDEVFWFTTQYIGSGGSRLTRVASFQVGSADLAADFIADPPSAEKDSIVDLVDLSIGNITSWSWSISPSTFVYENSTSANSQNPQVSFSAEGAYTVSLTISDGATNDTKTRTDYINVTNCTVNTLPFNEDFSDGSLPTCWMNIDHVGNGQVWRFDDPGGRSINTTTSGNGFAILDSDFYGSGNSQDADLVSPLLDFSAYSTVNLYFEHYFEEYPGSSAILYYSTDGGSSWSILQSWTVSTGNADVYDQDLTSLLATEPAVKFKWKYTGTWGYYWAIDDISITGTSTGMPGLWHGNASGEWSNPANWDDNNLPTNYINVTIPSSAANWPTVNGNLELGLDCKNISMNGSSLLTVNGDLVIQNGRKFSVKDNGMLMISGDWINYGSFIPGTGLVEFIGSNTSTMTGTTTSNMPIGQYSRTAFTKGMTVLSGGNSGPTVNDSYSDVPLGFTFFYAGNGYQQVRISSNGWASLGQTGTTGIDNAALFSSTVPNTTLAPWWDDLKIDATGVVKYATEGTAPERIFTAEWYRVLTFRNVSTSRISFQIKLYEGTNVIEFHYGNLENGTHSASESASIGIEDQTGGSGHFIEATTGSAVTGITDLTTPGQWPAVNFRFTPPPVVETFNDIIINKQNSTLEISRDLIVGGSLNIEQGAYFNINGTRTVLVNGIGN